MGAESFLTLQIVDFAEGVGDRVAALLQSGAGITITYDDEAGTITIANTGLGGSTGSTDNRILRADGTGGATVQNSAVTIDDSGNISGVANLTMSNTLTLGSFGVVAMNSSRGYFDCSALGVFYFRNFAGTKGFRLDCETTSGTVRFRNNDNSAASAIDAGADSKIGAWSFGSFGIRTGNGAGVGIGNSTGEFQIYNAYGNQVFSTLSVADGSTSNRVYLNNTTEWRDPSAAFATRATLNCNTGAFSCGAITASGTSQINSIPAGGGLVLVPSATHNAFHGLRLCSTSAAAERAVFLVQPTSGEIMIGANNGGGYYPVIYSNGTARLSFSTTGQATFSHLVSVGVFTVATLPSAAANAGALAQVTDSSVTTNGSAVSGSGSNRVVVFSNGSTWDVVVA